MNASSNYYIRSKNEPDKVVFVSDQDPEGVTITIKDNNADGHMVSFNLPRVDMIDALEYVLGKIKARQKASYSWK